MPDAPRRPAGQGHQWRLWLARRLPRGRPAQLAPVLAAALVVAALVAAFAPLSFGSGGSAHASGPELSFDLSCTPEQTVGGAVAFKYTVTNTGDQALTKVSVIDDRLGNVSIYFPGSLNPNESAEVIRYYIVQESDPRPFTNSATATYDPAAPVTDSCTVDVPHMTLTKTATVIDTSTTFTFTLENDGSTLLHRFRVVDSRLGDITEEFPLLLAPGATVVVEITVQRIEPCDNTVWAQYESVPRSLLVYAWAECTPGDFTIAKECVGVAIIGEDVTFKYTISNPSGGVPLTRVSVMDTILDDISSDFPATLNPSDTVVVELPYTVAGVPVTNTVTAVYRDDSTATDVTRQATATCATGQLLEVAKLNPDGSLWTTPVVTFHICAGDVVAAGCDPLSATFVRSVDLGNGNPNPALIPGLNAGIHTVCEVPPPNFTVEPSECQAVDIVAGTTTTVTFTNKPTDGGQACTPGYWKNLPKRLPQWTAAGYAPDTLFVDVFGFDDAGTLGQAVRARGGEEGKLFRFAVASLLAAAHPDVNFGLTELEVKAMAQEAYGAGDWGVFDGYFDDEKCPL